MAYECVQSNKGYAYASSVPVAFPSNVASGTLLLCTMHCYATGPHLTTPVADTRGNTWYPLGTVTSGGDGSLWLMWYYAISNGAGACTVTAAFQGSTYASVTIAEYSGIDTGASPVQNKSAGTSSSPASSATAVETSTVVIGVMTSMAGGLNTITEGSGYAMRQEYEDGSAAMHAGLEDKGESTDGSKTANFALGSSVGWICGIAIFKQAGAATKSFPPPNAAKRMQHLIRR